MIVGEVTNGGSHPPEKFRVGASDVFLSIPVIHSDTHGGPRLGGGRNQPTHPRTCTYRPRQGQRDFDQAPHWPVMSFLRQSRERSRSQRV